MAVVYGMPQLRGPMSPSPAQAFLPFMICSKAVPIESLPWHRDGWHVMLRHPVFPAKVMVEYSEMDWFLVSWHLVLWLGKNIFIPGSIYKYWSLIFSAFERRDACRQCCPWLQSFCSPPYEVEKQILGERECKEAARI